MHAWLEHKYEWNFIMEGQAKCFGSKEEGNSFNKVTFEWSREGFLGFHRVWKSKIKDSHWQEQKKSWKRTWQTGVSTLSAWTWSLQMRKDVKRKVTVRAMYTKLGIFSIESWESLKIFEVQHVINWANFTF